MLIALSDALEIPLRERNTLFQAAGYAPLYRETPMDAPQMAQVQKAIDAILRAHTISPAIVINRRYDVVASNAAAIALTGTAPMEASSQTLRPNLLRLLLSPHCLRPAIENWQEVRSSLVRQALRESEALDSRRVDLLAILDECVPDRGARILETTDWTQPADVVLPIRLRVGDARLSLFSTITTLGTPGDITLQELRIEAFHPADAETEAYLVRAASAPS